MSVSDLHGRFSNTVSTGQKGRWWENRWMDGWTGWCKFLWDVSNQLKRMASHCSDETVGLKLVLINEWKWRNTGGWLDEWRTVAYADLRGRPQCSSCIPAAAEDSGKDLWLSASHGSWTMTVWETITLSLFVLQYASRVGFRMMSHLFQEIISLLL